VSSKLLKFESILLGSKNEHLEVNKITSVMKEGIFSPWNVLGKMIVNGDFCSNYAFSTIQWRMLVFTSCFTIERS
jgi:hypothetical protein